MIHCSLLDAHHSLCGCMLLSCMDLHVPDHHLLDLPLGSHLHAQSMDSITLHGADDDMHAALAYADMREAFAEFGGEASEELYWREMELRSYSSYMQQAEELLSHMQVDVEAARLVTELTEGRRKHRLASLSPSISASASTLASPLRVLLINTMQSDSNVKYSSLSSIVYSMMQQPDFAPLALLTQLDWDISYVVVTESPSATGCRRCDLYHRPECADMFLDNTATLIPHIQHQTTEANLVLETNAVKLSTLDYGGYDIVLTLDAILPLHITQRTPRPLYAHYVHSACVQRTTTAQTIPAQGYHLYLHPQLSQLDVLSAGERMIHFPASLLYHGVFQSLLDLPPALLANRSIVTALVGVEEAFELTGTQLEVLTSVVSQLGLSEYRAITPVIQPQSDVSVFIQSRVCLFLPGLFTPSLKRDAAQQRALTSHLLHAIAAGCLVIVTEEVAAYTLTGEHDGHDALRLLLSPQTVAAAQGALLAIVGMAADRSWLEREVAYQRSALNAHMMEKPLHSLLDAYTQRNIARRA